MKRVSIRVRVTLAFTLLILVFAGVSGFVAFTLIRQTAEQGAVSKAKSDLALGQALIETRYPGGWEVRDGELYKGEVRMNENFALVDEIAGLTGGTATLFLGDTRVATTVKVKGTDKRAVGTQAAPNVVQRVLKEGQPYFGEALVAGNKFQTAYTPLKNPSGEIIGMWYVGVSKKFLDALLWKASIQLFLAVSFIIALSMVAAWFFARTFSRPLEALSGIVAEIEAGDLSRRFTERRSDEIGSLGGRFNLMVETMGGIIRGIAGASHDVAEAARDLRQSSESFSAAHTSVAGAVQSIASSSDSQVHLTDEALHAAQGMAQTVAEVARYSQEVSRVAQEAAATANSGIAAIERAVNQMGSVGQTVESFSGTIRSLGERSQQIGRIVDLITGIADQTNLLALNAAIEAARAGEQGRGFAVVAEEVRKLAEQSAEAAKQIATLVKEIQTDTAQVVDVMDTETAQVTEGVSVVNEAGSAFRDLVSGIRALTQRIEQVASAATAMSRESAEVVETVEGIARAARQVASQTAEVAGGTEEQVATAEELSALAASLTTLATQLSASIQTFRV